MTIEECKELEARCSNTSIPPERVCNTDEEWGYTIGWLWRCMKKKDRFAHDRMSRHFDKRSRLQKATMDKFKKVNVHFSESDTSIKKLVTVVFAGFANRKDQSDVVSAEIKMAMILGHNGVK